MLKKLSIAETLDFSTLDMSEREFFTIEFKSPYDDPNCGRFYLWIDGPTDGFKARIWVEGEKIIDFDEETKEYVVTDEESEPHFINLDFSPDELDKIKWKLIQYLHCLCYDGKEYALMGVV